MKISIKREQSQAGLSFAEREKFRPQVKNKLLLLLALLLTAATGGSAETRLYIFYSPLFFPKYEALFAKISYLCSRYNRNNLIILGGQ